MVEWYSERFQCLVFLTKHATARMHERMVSHDIVRELIETGLIQYKDEHRLWIYKAFKEREDNLICAAAVLEDKLIIKTIMHRWQLEEISYEN